MARPRGTDRPRGSDPDPHLAEEFRGRLSKSKNYQRTRAAMIRHHGLTADEAMALEQHVRATQPLPAVPPRSGPVRERMIERRDAVRAANYRAAQIAAGAEILEVAATTDYGRAMAPTVYRVSYTHPQTQTPVAIPISLRIPSHLQGAGRRNYIAGAIARIFSGSPGGTNEQDFGEWYEAIETGDIEVW